MITVAIDMPRQEKKGENTTLTCWMFVPRSALVVNKGTMSTTVASRYVKLVGRWFVLAVRSVIWENTGDVWLVPREGSGLAKVLSGFHEAISSGRDAKISLFWNEV